MAKFKRIVAAVMVAATMTTSAIGGMSANADYTDTNITNFIAPPSAAGTFNPLPLSQNGVRVKSTDTSVYLNVTKSTYNVSVQPGDSQIQDGLPLEKTVLAMHMVP